LRISCRNRDRLSGDRGVADNGAGDTEARVAVKGDRSGAGAWGGAGGLAAERG